jgi:putative DNA primase/helicase
VTSDSHKNTETRRSLQPLVDMAARMNAALVGITHFSKGGQGSDPAQRVIGSIAFTAVARVVLVAAKVQSDDGQDRRILARGKSNIGPDDGGYEYHLEQVEALPGIQASRVGWGKSVEGSARELLSDPDEPGEDANDACELLKAELAADSWTPYEEACKPLGTAGFTKKQIWAASKKLGVIRRKGGMKDGWYLRLPGGSVADPKIPGPEDSPEDSEGSNFGNGESSESSAGLESSEEEVL